MKNLVIYSGGGGLGLILETHEKEEDYIKAESVVLHGQTISPGEMTTLDGQFTKPIRYAGLLKNKENNTMCFHTGDTKDLFNHKKFYYCYVLIDENRIMNIYKAGTARDYFFKNGQWK